MLCWIFQRRPAKNVEDIISVPYICMQLTRFTRPWHIWVLKAKTQFQNIAIPGPRQYPFRILHINFLEEPIQDKCQIDQLLMSRKWISLHLCQTAWNTSGFTNTKRIFNSYYESFLYKVFNNKNNYR